MTVCHQVAPMESPCAASTAEMSDETTSDDNSTSAMDASIYDVPPSHSEEDVFHPGAEGPLVPPVLPPKKKQVHESIDERLGMVMRAPDANPQRPVPVPRKSVRKPVPRPRTKRRSQMPLESHDLGMEQMPERDSVKSDDIVTQVGGVVTKVDSVVSQGDDVTQGLVQCNVQSGLPDGGDNEGHLAPHAEREERNNNEPISVVYDDVYVAPDDILVDNDGEVTIAKDTHDSVSDVDDACRGDYIVMDDQLYAGVADGDTYPYPGPVEDRVVIGAEADDRRADSQSSEEIYGQVWVMNSGKTESTVGPCNLSLTSVPQKRGSVVSFCAPPPSYAPPPLPQGVMVPPDIADFPPPSIPPPSIPPRPVGYKPPPPTSMWGVAGPRPESVAFSEFINERFESEKQAELNDACSSQGSDCSTPPPQPKRTLLPSSREASPYRDVFRERNDDREDARPKPPPRVPNPFQSMYDPISRTYSVNIDLSPGTVMTVQIVFCPRV